MAFAISAVAAATVPSRARTEIAAWTAEHLQQWGHDDLIELHAHKLKSAERLAVCKMLASRGDVFAAAVVTSTMLLRSLEAVINHRQRQHVLSKASWESATTDDGLERGRIASGMLKHETRMHDGFYVEAAMTPIAIVGAVQRAFCFYSEDDWIPEMSSFTLHFDEDAKALKRYLRHTLLPMIGDNRFTLLTPLAWRDPPLHPLLARASHPDSDGYATRELLPDVTWLESSDEPAVQVADVVAHTLYRGAHGSDGPNGLRLL